MILYEKLIRLPSTELWRTYDITKPRRLKTQDGFIQKVFKLLTDYSLQNVPLEELLKPVNPIHIRPVIYECTLMKAMTKSSSLEIELKAAALETIYTRYPNNNWIHIYTDGSKMNDSVGVGVYSEYFAFYAALGPFRTNFDGELEAIRIATEQINVRSVQLNNIVIFSDSISAIQAISAHNVAESKIIDSCRRNIDLLSSKGMTVVLQWIPSHVGINGNEWADRLAKKGTDILQSQINSEVPFLSIKRIIKSVVKKNFEKNLFEEIKNKKWRDAIDKIPDSPRSIAVAAFRLETGHDCLAKHLYRIGVYSSPLCTLCNQNIEMDKDHLQNCTSLNEENLYNRYWQARGQMQLAS